MNAEHRPNRRIKVTTYQPEVGVSSTVVTCIDDVREQMGQFDFLLALCMGVYGFRDTEGVFRERPLRGSGLGTKAQLLISVLQEHRGWSLGCCRLADLCNNEDYFDPRVVAAQVARIRRALNEDGTSARFLLTNLDGGYYWSKAMSWILIERMDPED